VIEPSPLPATGARVLLLGATGTIGRATAQALLRRGYQVICLIRSRATVGGSRLADNRGVPLAGAQIRTVDFQDPLDLERAGFRGEHFDAVVSCMASRTGTPSDAWAVDYQAHLNVLQAASTAQVRQFVLLSAICVQKPKLAFQQAKLAFEKALSESAMTYSIVRATAFFKSLSGQVERVKRGKPYLVFGDGTLTACKPISDRDLAEFLADCLRDPQRWNRILPIGGPGAAVTPLQQGEFLFARLGITPRYRQVPVAVLDAVVAVLGALGRIVPPLAKKAELARIGRYYATESMLIWDAAANKYDAASTPSAGEETLFDYYSALIDGSVCAERGDHAVF
jgi:divinyl chlorophyllide a 8-vinyl-reductase